MNKEKMETYTDYLIRRIDYEKRMQKLASEGFDIEIEALEKHLEAWERKILAKEKEVICCTK